LCDDATHVLITYSEGATPFYGTAIIATISGTTISYGSEYVFNSGLTGSTSSCTLDSTHALIAYGDTSNSNYGTGVIATISGTTISYGSDYVFNSAVTAAVSCSMIDGTHAIIAYKDDSAGTAVIATISGTTISYGSEYVFNSASTQWISSTMLDTTHALISYQDYNDGGAGSAVIATLSGSTISYGSEYTFNNASTEEISSCTLDSTHALISYEDAGNASYGTAVIATISGSVITFGPEFVYNSAATAAVDCSALSSTTVLIAYQDTGSSSYGRSIVATAQSVISLDAIQSGSNIDLAWIWGLG